MFKSKIFILFIFLFFYKLDYSQISRPFIQNFTQQNYGDSCSTQNWSICQDKNRNLYFGNNLRILSYDGEDWNTIRTSEFGSYVTSLFANKNKIYVGANGEFGEIIIDTLGRQKYLSLSQNLNNDDAFFTNIWKIYSFNNSIIFFSQEKIFILKNNKITVLNPETSFHLGFVVNNNFYVRQRNIGLMKLTNNKFKKINDGEIFKDYGVFGIFKTSEKHKLLIITQEIGAFYYFDNKTDSAIIQIENNDKNKLISSNIYGGTSLNDGNIALNTNQNGIIIINDKAEIINIINKNTGLIDNDIKDVFQDENGDIWLAMNTGISRINYSSQISSFNNNSRLNGNISSISFNNNNLYVGSSDGLFKYNLIEQKFIKNIFFNKQILQLLSIDNTLFISTESGIYTKSENKISKVSNIINSKFFYSNKNKILIVVGENKIEIFKNQNNLWNPVKQINDIFINNITSIEQDKTENDSLIFWIGTLNSGLFKIKFADNLNHKIENFTNQDGLLPGWIIPLKTEKQVLFGTVGGLLKYSKLDSLGTKNINYKGFFETANFNNLDNDAISILQDYKNNILLCRNGKVELYNKSTNKIIDKYFKSIDLGKINTILKSNNNILIGGNKGISIINLDKKKDFSKKPNIQIKKIINSNDSIIYYGNNSINPEITLDYSNNSIKIIFASNFIDNNKTAQYSYFIENYDEKWSNWSNENSANYKKIPSGEYIFKVKSKNIYDVESKIAEFKFNILPPFYKTFWAYLIYFVLFIILISFIIKIYTRKLEKDKIRLEGIIEERTIEIRHQKDEIVNQRDKIIEIHSELKDSINYAKRIQQAVLPSDEYLNSILNDYFVLFNPKDVVSGDFYWATKVNEHIIITAADCTGHGVPGAFMSMLGTSFLNEIVKNSKTIKANEILFEIRNSIIDALKQTGEEGEQKDGMDMSLCTINTKTYEVQWAGANNPLYIIKKGEINSNNKDIKLFQADNILDYKLYEIKADKMPISIYIKMDKFKNNIIQLDKGDNLYMFSDGFADQFGGPKGKKFKYKPFKRLLLENYKKPMYEQKQILQKAFNDWKINTEQIDDVVIIGIKL